MSYGFETFFSLSVTLCTWLTSIQASLENFEDNIRAIGINFGPRKFEKSFLKFQNVDGTDTF